MIVPQIAIQNCDLAIIRMTAPALCEHDRHGRTRYMILNGPRTTDRYVKGWHFHLQGSRHSRSMTQTTRASLTWTLSRPSLRRNVDVRYGSFYMVRLDSGHRYFWLGLSRGQNGIDNRFGVKLVWKELPQHFDGCPAELQWMVTSSHRMLLWCLLCQHSSIAWSGTWLRRHFWWGTLGGSAGQHGWLV